MDGVSFIQHLPVTVSRHGSTGGGGGVSVGGTGEVSTALCQSRSQWSRRRSWGAGATPRKRARGKNLALSISNRAAENFEARLEPLLTSTQVSSGAISRRDLLMSVVRGVSAAGVGALLGGAGVAGAARADGRGGRGLAVGDAEEVLRTARFPAEWPYTAADFRRFDEAADGEFYASPRYARHVDDGCVRALRAYHERVLSQFMGEVQVLDLCASVESYLPTSSTDGANVTTVGLGMNTAEMDANPQLQSHVVHDLNKDPALPFADAAFDAVVCATSIDYLTRPREVCAQIGRVLKPGGIVLISFSDRVFATKAVAVWMNSGNEDHIYTVASYLHYCIDPTANPNNTANNKSNNAGNTKATFTNIRVDDISPRRFGKVSGDPMYVVSARRA